ncbi:unnamed protein product [Urochloa decumbens]|uniref:Uncharacterized protein n=1 Tax=Urochloa decumbens TaxID=240449 RepID=A0ABC9BMX1_9POAL
MASWSLVVVVALLVLFLSAGPASVVYSYDGNPYASGLLQRPKSSSDSSKYQLYIVLLKPKPESGTMDMATRRSWYRSFLPGDLTDSGEPRLVHSYKALFDGFCARLTEAEVEVMSKKPGFGRWFPDGTMELMTTRTPAFLGLSKDAGLWSNASYGKGVIIGVADSGINSGHPSFDDHDMPPPPARWKGVCTGSGTRCNNKLVGARSFMADGDPADNTGHGTHTASTAAGNFVEDASVYKLAAGTASGIAPGAHLAVYKGIIVVAAGGNAGPRPSTITNDAPWLLTVGAGSLDRRLSAVVVLESGDLIQGEALVQGTNSSQYYPLRYPGDHNNYCIDTSSDQLFYFAGNIVLCDAFRRGNTTATASTTSQASIINNLKDTGVAGVVLINPHQRGYAISLRDFGGQVIQVSFNGVELGVNVESPVVASFSSRGPSPTTPGVLKPDVLAPGLNILAASVPQARWPFAFKSGTSMAAPHVSGVAALIKSLHPDWSPAAIKSAIMTTADVLDNNGLPIMDEQHNGAGAFSMGAGHANPTRAVDPGLVYDLSVTDYAGYFCDLFGEEDQAYAEDTLTDVVRDLNLTCSTLPKIPEAQLNYPTIMVPMVDSGLFTVQRTLTNVGPGAETYTAKFYIPDDDINSEVSPDTLHFSQTGERLTFNVSIEYQATKDLIEGSLIWTSDKHTVRSTLVVYRK